MRHDDYDLLHKGYQGSQIFRDFFRSTGSCVVVTEQQQRE